MKNKNSEETNESFKKGPKEPKIKKEKELKKITSKKAIKEESKVEIIIEEKPFEVTKGVVMEKPKELSFHAQKWANYLGYLKFPAEDFLKKYPSHKYKEFIEELIEFNKNSEK